MKIRMEVTRFTNEDVIVTSAGGGIVVPSDVCAHTGMKHLLATRVSYDSATDVSTVTGPVFNYIEKGHMQSLNALEQVVVSGRVSRNTFLYDTGSGYAVCEPQPHAR